MRARRAGRLLATLAAAPVVAQDESAVPAAESAAPAGESPLAGKKVAFVLWGYDGYQQAQGNWFVKAATDAGAEARAIDGQVDPNVQVEILSDLVAEQVDGIVFQPVEPNAAVNAINEVQAAGIPLTLRRRPRYDHSYHFIASFIEDQLRWHARKLQE